MTSRGQMLVVVLWVMGLLTLSVGAVTSRASHELRLGRVPLEWLQREAIAQAGLQQAIAYLAQDPPEVDHLDEVWATGLDVGTDAAVFEAIPVGAGRFSIGARAGETFVPGMIDEERKLNLNQATPDQLSRLMTAVSPGDVDVNQAVLAILDWRDEPSGVVCGQERVQCHNGPFNTVRELRLVPGVTAELFEALEPYVTVYGSGSVNVNTASPLILDAWSCNGAQLAQQRRSQPFTSPPEACPSSTVTSTVFSVPVEAEVGPAGNRMRLLAVVDRQGHVLNFLIDTF